MRRRNTQVTGSIAVFGVLLGALFILVSVFAGPGISRDFRSAVTSETLPKEPGTLQRLNVEDMRAQMLLRVNAARSSRDMNKLSKLGDEIEAARETLGPEHYASLMLEVCNAFSSIDAKDDNQYVLEQKYALLALSKPITIPADIEALLVLHLAEDIEYAKGSVTAEQWVDKRRDKADIWLRAWQHLSAAIDPHFDFNDLPLLNVPLPPGVPGAAGMAPDQIKDPTLRTQYQRAIDANKKKAEEYRRQNSLYKTREIFRERMEAYLIRSYSRPPVNAEEIETMLRTHLVDENTRFRILNGIK